LAEFVFRHDYPFNDHGQRTNDDGMNKL